jgi:hypothetical protein
VTVGQLATPLNHRNALHVVGNDSDRDPGAADAGLGHELIGGHDRDAVAIDRCRSDGGGHWRWSRGVQRDAMSRRSVMRQINHPHGRERGKRWDRSDWHPALDDAQGRCFYGRAEHHPGDRQLSGGRCLSAIERDVNLHPADRVVADAVGRSRLRA